MGGGELTPARASRLAGWPRVSPTRGITARKRAPGGDITPGVKAARSRLGVEGGRLGHQGGEGGARLGRACFRSFHNKACCRKTLTLTLHHADRRFFERF